MSIMQVTEYLLWKSLKHKTATSSFLPVCIKEEASQKPEDFINNIMMCRVCTKPAEIPITEKIENNIIIMSAIRTVANITINIADNYPKYVCKICLGELKIAFEFKKKCEASDMMFRKAISSETTLVINSQSMIKHDFSLILHQMSQKRQCHSKLIKHETNDDGVDIGEVSIYSPNECSEETSQCDSTNVSPMMERGTKTSFDDIIKSTENNMHKTCKTIIDVKPIKIAIDKYSSKRKEGKKLHKIQKCKRCDLKFDSKEDFQKHRKGNSCVYHPCPQCGKLVLNLANHEKIMHSRPNKYTCHQCGKIYYSSGALCNHMHIHKDTKEYFCEHCPYRGKRKSYLVCHMRVHTGEQRYLCSMCPLKFTNPSNLRKHQLIHFNKKFECSKCKRLFRQKRYLKEHFEAVHLNIRYRCSICGRDLISRKKLLNHELRVHKREKHILFEEVQTIVIGNDNDG